MSERDIDGNLLVLSELLKAAVSAGEPEDDVKRQTLEAGLALLGGFLKDVNRIADAAEMIATDHRKYVDAKMGINR